MGQIIALNHVTLDGVIQSGGGPQEDPSGGFTHGGWSVPFRSDEGAKAVLEIMSRPFDLLLGRRTYEIWAGFWPSASHPVASAFNKVAKYVVTKSLGSLEWANSRPLGGDVVDEIRRLKAPMDQNCLLLHVRFVVTRLVVSERFQALPPDSTPAPF